MKARLMLAVPLMVGVALAQSQRIERPVAERQRTVPRASAQADRQSGSQGGRRADPTKRSQSGAQMRVAEPDPRQARADPVESGSQAGTMTGSQSSASGSGTGDAAQMKTMTYRGTLVDLSCGAATASAGAGASDTSSTSAAAGTPRAGGAASSAGSTAPVSEHRFRLTPVRQRQFGQPVAPGDSSNCPVTASSSQLGLKMDNGQVVRFDLVGNQRAQDEMKNNKKWTSAVVRTSRSKLKSAASCKATS